MLVKILIVLALLVIVSSLFSALYFLSKDKTGSDRTVKALTVRISLSFVLFFCLMAAYYFGYIGPNKL